MPGQGELAAEVERVALVVIEGEISRRWNGAIREQAADDASMAEGELIGVVKVELAAVTDAGRTKSKFPAGDAGGLDGDGEEEVGIVETVVVKEIVGAGDEIIGVDGPALDGNGEAELMFFVAFAVQRNKG